MKLFKTPNLLDQVFLLRIFSFSIYLVFIIVTFFIGKKTFFSNSEAILFTLIVSLQPMLNMAGSQINPDIALVFSSSLFFLLSLKIIEYPSQKLLYVFLILTLFSSFLSKGTGYTLIIPLGYLLFYVLYKMYMKERKISFIFISGLCTFLAVSVLFSWWFYKQPIVQNVINIGNEKHFSNHFYSLIEYLKKTITLSDFQFTSQSYWGSFGWLDTTLPDTIITIIWVIELIAFVGLLLYWKKITLRREYLPSPPILLFSLIYVLSFQFFIRFIDWQLYHALGRIETGTPGRYFLPAVIPHFILIVTGLGVIFTKTKKQFEHVLKIFAACMFILLLYSFLMIVSRYYF